MIDIGDAQLIDDLVAAFGTALSDPASDHFMELSETLYEKLIQPLSPHIAKNERLLFSTDGALNILPFAAIIDNRGDYLLKRFELTYLTSGRELLRMPDKSSPREAAVVLADPNYGDPPPGGPTVDSSLQPARSADLDRGGLIFTPLPGTADEAAALQRLLNPTSQHVITGDRATEASLRELHGPRVLHVATHGFFLNDLRTKLLLKGLARLRKGDGDAAIVG